MKTYLQKDKYTLVNSLDKLRILKFDFSQVKYSKDVIEEYKRLKKINNEGLNKLN